MKVSTNEATTSGLARNFINPFIVEAVAKGYPLLVGSRAYGFMNYIIKIVITEAKMTGDMEENIFVLQLGVHFALRAAAYRLLDHSWHRFDH